MAADAVKLVPAPAADGYYVHADHLGSPQAMTDDVQQEVWRIDTRPFGEVEALTWTVENNQRFPGQYEDAESGYSYNWFRDYEPALGRYLQSDPIGLAGGINTFAYVGGNPVGRTDWRALCSDPDPEGSGYRYCIEEYIPDSSAWMFTGDNRGPTSNGGTYRSQQLVWNGPDGSLQSSTDAGISQLGPFENTGDQGPHSIIGMCETETNVIHAINNTSNGLVPIAPYAWYNLEIRESGGSATVLGSHSAFPNLEVWQYGNGSPKLIYDYRIGDRTPISLYSPPVIIERE